MPAAASSRGSKAAFGESHLRVPLEGRRRGALERAAEARLRAKQRHEALPLRAALSLIMEDRTRVS